MHINLPFQGDKEFGQLHAAVRLVLPLLPGIAASSPIVDGKQAPYRDARLHYYGHHCDVIPLVTGGIIPEAIFTRDEYRQQILEPIYQEIAPHDTDGILQDDFINARGAIPRFERSSLEIRLLDMQECVAADLAIAVLVTEVSKLLVQQTHSTTAQQQAMASEPLREIYQAAVRDGEDAVIDSSEFLQHFGIAAGRKSLAELWHHLAGIVLQQNQQLPDEIKTAIQQVTTLGTLSTRLLQSCAGDFSPVHLKAIYSKLCDCLAENRFFTP
jgi:gamma-glutamyl:cysteine ligase YbdK (ATP-grasp superfamily)